MVKGGIIVAAVLLQQPVQVVTLHSFAGRRRLRRDTDRQVGCA